MRLENVCAGAQSNSPIQSCYEHSLVFFETKYLYVNASSSFLRPRLQRTCNDHRRRLLNFCGCAAFPLILSLSFLSFLPSFFTVSFSLPSFTLISSPASAEGFGERLSSSRGSGRSPGAKRHLVHFGLETNASRESGFSAVYEIIASYHETQAFRWRKLQNGGRILWVFSTHIIVRNGCSRP